MKTLNVQYVIHAFLKETSLHLTSTTVTLHKAPEGSKETSKTSGIHQSAVGKWSTGGDNLGLHQQGGTQSEHPREHNIDYIRARIWPRVRAQKTQQGHISVDSERQNPPLSLRGLGILELGIWGEL